MTVISYDPTNASPPPLRRVPGSSSRRPAKQTLALLAIGLVVLFIVGRLHDLIPGLGSVPVAMIFIPVAIVLFLFSGGAERQGRLVLRTSQTRWLLVFVAVACLTVPFAVVRTSALTNVMQFMRADLIVVLLIAASIRSGADLALIVRSVVVSAGLVGFMSGRVGIAAGGEGRYSVTGIYDPNDIALICVVSLPLAFWLLRNPAGRLLNRIVGGAGLAGALMGIMFSGSRGGFVALVVVVVAQVLFFGRAMPLRWRLIFGVAIGGGLTLAPATFWERMNSLRDPSSDYNMTADEGRIAVWKRGLGYFAGDPLTGVGFGQFGNAEGHIYGADKGPVLKWSAAHNSFIQVLAELGVIGFISWLGVFVPTLRLARRLKTHRWGAPPDVAFGGAYIVAFIGFATGGFFLSAAYYPVAFVLMALGIGWTTLMRADPTLRARPLAARQRHGRAPAAGPAARPSGGMPPTQRLGHRDATVGPPFAYRNGDHF